MNDNKTKRSVVLVIILTLLSISTQLCFSYALTETSDSIQTRMSNAASTVKELNTSEKEELLGGNELIDVQNSNIIVRDLQMDNGEKAMDVLAMVALDDNASKGLPSGSSNRPQAVRSYMTIQAAIGYQDRSFSGIAHSKGLFYGGRIISQSNDVVVKSLKGKYHETGGYMTSGGQQGTTVDYSVTKSFKVSKRYQWQYYTVNRDKYYSTVMPLTALETKFTVKGTVLNNSFTFSLDAIRIRNGA